MSDLTKINSGRWIADGKCYAEKYVIGKNNCIAKIFTSSRGWEGIWADLELEDYIQSHTYAFKTKQEVKEAIELELEIRGGGTNI
jgi:hypothetical protein